LSLLARPYTLADALIPIPRSDSRLAALAIDGVLVLSFAAFVALSAQIVVRLPFTPVPITGQTFAVLVTGGALGAWRGASALLVYMLVGTAGLAIFAPTSANLDMEGKTLHFILPWLGTGDSVWDLSSGGYIVGFILAAWVVGYLAQQNWDRGPWLIVGMLVGNALLYVPGLLWLAYLVSTEWIHPDYQVPLGELITGEGTWEKTLVGGLYPFIVGDLIKLYLASLALPSAWALVNMRRR